MGDYQSYAEKLQRALAATAARDPSLVGRAIDKDVNGHWFVRRDAITQGYSHSQTMVVGVLATAWREYHGSRSLDGDPSTKFWPPSFHVWRFLDRLDHGQICALWELTEKPP